jgi:hypothetical protein
VISTGDLVVLLGCASLVSLAFGVLLGVWLCDRKMVKVLREGTGGNESIHEYKRNLADLNPGDRL